jgi:hypothetical protein
MKTKPSQATTNLIPSVEELVHSVLADVSGGHAKAIKQNKLGKHAKHSTFSPQPSPPAYNLPRPTFQ